MEVITLVSRGVKFLLNTPYRAFRFFGRVSTFRELTLRSKDLAANEVRVLSGGQEFVRGFFFFLKIVVAVAVIAGAFYGLWYLNRFWDLERQLGGPLPIARRYWLPTLFGLFLLALGLGTLVLRSLGPHAEPKEFADIHAAWADALEALAAADIGVKDVPVFVLLGRAAGGVGAVADASRLGFTVRGAPDRGDAPVRVHATPQGIYVSCPGVGLLAELAGRLSGTSGPAVPDPAAALTVFDDRVDFDAPVAGVVPYAGDFLLPDDGPAKAKPPAPVREVRVPQLLADGAAVKSAAARLAYLGRLLAFHREPFCGANGAVLLVPADAVHSDAGGDQAAGAAAADLAALGEGLGLSLPAAVVVCDLETVPGAAEFLRLTPPDRRDRLVGLPFPPLHDVAIDRLPAAAAETVKWTGGAIERMLLKSVQIGERTATEELEGNTALYRFLAGVRGALPRLERLAARVAVPDGTAARFAGAYLAATGAEPAQRAFLAGVFRVLADNQNAVAWTAAARAVDGAYKLWSMIGYLLIAAALIAVGVWAYADWAEW